MVYKYVFSDLYELYKCDGVMKN